MADELKAITSFLPKWTPKNLTLVGCGCASVLTLALVFLIGIGVWWSNRNEARAIEQVLVADAHAFDGASCARDGVKNMMAINLSGCPKDFREAYRAHIRAWRDKGVAEDAAKHWQQRYNSENAFLEGFFRGLGGDFGIIGESETERKKILEMYNQASADIDSTFAIVKEIAIDHGASVSNE